MKAWQVGIIVGIALLLGLMGPVANSVQSVAEELPVPISASPQIVLPQAPQPAITVTPADREPLPGRIAAMQSLPAVSGVAVRPDRRSGFERWRRGLPYGMTGDPITQFLTEDD